MPLCLHKLNLSHFRNYATLRLAPAGAPTVVLTGANGAGKTNLLEAVSLLGPGKGLRGADLLVMQHRPANAPPLTDHPVFDPHIFDPWAVSAEIETPLGETARIGTGLARTHNNLARDSKRRIARLDGRDVKNHGALAAIAPCVWLTPQMDGLFTDSPGQRRRFIDRLVLARNADHAAHVTRAEKNTRQRQKLLQDARDTRRAADPAWLSTLESEMAEDFIAIANARRETTRALTTQMRLLQTDLSPFPLPDLDMTGDMEDFTDPAALQSALAKNRSADTAANRTLIGTHRSDLSAQLTTKNMPAAACSTGEQKGMLAAIILAHALMTKAEKGFAPLILLDEIAAHLDAARQDRLFALLKTAGSQVWITGTDPAAFVSLKNEALFLNVENGQALQTPALRAIK